MCVGSGVVTSVPSDAPDDYAALRDLKKKKVSTTTTTVHVYTCTVYTHTCTVYCKTINVSGYYI